MNSLNSSVNKNSNSVPQYDYPMMLKIFQTLFNKPGFFNSVFFPADDALTNTLHKQMENSKTILYQSIISQLLFDGHNSIAKTLQETAISDVSELLPDNTLHQMFDILFYIENRSKFDFKFKNLMHWFLSINTEDQLNLTTVASNTNMSSLYQMDSQTFSGTPVIYETENETQIPIPLNASYVGPARPLHVAYKFGQLGSEEGCVDTPHGFCLGLDDDIVIADTNNHRICVFDLKGQFKYCFGEYGTETGKLHQPRKIAMLPPEVLSNQSEPIFIVCDRGTKRSRMQVFTLKGKFIRLIDIPSMDIVSGLTTTQDRKIVVVDSVRSGVLVMDEFGGLLNWFTCAPHMMEPSDIAIHNKKFYICDFKGHCISVFNSHGILMDRLSAKMLKFPNGIDISNQGDIICGDSHGNRFHISAFDKDGRLIGDYDCPFVKVSRCCGLRLTNNGLIVTLAKNNNHTVVMKGISVQTQL